LVIAAHPDDEVLGMGGTIKKLSYDNEIHLCIITEGASAQYSDKKMIQKRKKSCEKSSGIIGISKIHFLDFPDMKLDTISHLDINRQLEEIMNDFRPEIVFTTPSQDLNKDHELTFKSTLVAARPYSGYVKKILSYELPGTVNSQFNPNTYVDISEFISTKINAFKQYSSEVRKFPHPRSIKSIESLSIVRGVECGKNRAEAFQLIRSIE